MVGGSVTTRRRAEMRRKQRNGGVVDALTLLAQLTSLASGVLGRDRLLKGRTGQSCSRLHCELLPMPAVSGRFINLLSGILWNYLNNEYIFVKYFSKIFLKPINLFK